MFFIPKHEIIMSQCECCCVIMCYREKVPLASLQAIKCINYTLIYKYRINSYLIIRINYTIMNKRYLFTIISIVAFVASSFTASAFPATKYTNLSKLASGNWVSDYLQRTQRDGIHQSSKCEDLWLGR